MAEQGITINEYNTIDNLITGNVEEKVVTIKAAEGSLSRGQALAYNTSGEWVKYVSGGSNDTGIVRAILNEDADASTVAVNARVIVSGEINGKALIGVDFVTKLIDTPDAPTLELVAGGSLTATTQYDYKLAAKTDLDGITATGTAANATTLAVSSGKAEGLVVADIAAVNAVLGDCSTTAKVVQFTVDGVQFSATFALDYSGAGALADHAALVAALNGTGYTPSSSDGAAITLTSDTTGVDSIVRITADTTGLFSSPTYTDGMAESETIKVTFTAVDGATGYRLWRSDDGGSTWEYKDLTEAEIEVGFVVDDGTATFTSGTPVTADDYSAIADMWDRGIYISEIDEGYNFRGGY